MKYAFLYLYHRYITKKLRIIILETQSLSNKYSLEVGDKINYLYTDWNSSKFKPFLILKKELIESPYIKEIKELEKLIEDVIIYNKQAHFKFSYKTQEIDLKELRIKEKNYKEKYKYYYIIS